MFATELGVGDAPDMLWRVMLDASGKAVGRVRVQHGTDGFATDTADGRTVFVRRDAVPTGMIWIREPDGQSRPLTEGQHAIFTPGRSALLVERESPERDDSSDLYLYYFADDRLRLVYSAQPFARVVNYRYSFDGLRWWMVENLNNGDGFRLLEYDVRKREVVRTLFSVIEGPRCVDVEVLPSGRRLALICSTQQTGLRLHIVRLADGWVHSPAVTGSHWDDITKLHGRLSDRALLASWAGSAGTALGELDLETYTLRRLTNTKGLSYGVAPY